MFQVSNFKKIMVNFAVNFHRSAKCRLTFNCENPIIDKSLMYSDNKKLLLGLKMKPRKWSDKKCKKI